jgi:hypothetical protein
MPQAAVRRRTYQEDPLSWKNADRLGRKYALLPVGPEKEAKFLEIAQFFHGYVMKYLTMISQGHVLQLMAPQGSGKLFNTDSLKFIKYFLPKGMKATKAALSNTCHAFHLAFKGMDPDEVYDVLMEKLLRAAQKYDPLYSEKVGRVVQILNYDNLVNTRFTLNELNKHLGFDGARFVRVLCRHGFLEPEPAVPGSERMYRRQPATWPPSSKYLNAGPIGFTYYLQTRFRYYLQTYIEQAMCRLESKEGVYSLSYTRDVEDGRGDCELLDACGAVVDRDAQDQPSSLTDGQPRVDLSRMTLSWVNHTTDPLFADYTREERYILYLIFVRDFKWEQVANTLQVSPNKAKGIYRDLMARLKQAIEDPFDDDDD